MHSIEPIHPFPARMAPEIALRACSALPRSSVILDPMAGSGTVLRMAAEHGHKAIGFDIDPLAVLLAKVWTTPIDTDQLRATAAVVTEQAIALSSGLVSLPWIDDDKENAQFVDFWFARKQKQDLRRLCSTLYRLTGRMADALRVSVSRLIITKSRGASLAGDVSHSRPHRIRTENDFDVFSEFRKSVNYVAKLLEIQQPPGNVDVRIGDARHLVDVATASIDAVITSPPYLNAIDYLRGHRMTLVWLGYHIRDLRAIRSEMVGAERAPDAQADLTVARELIASTGQIEGLSKRRKRMVYRYALDLLATMTEISRVLKSGGRATLVIGNSQHRGVFIENTQIVLLAAERSDLRLIRQSERQLPPCRRYLPPPDKQGSSDLGKRLRTEVTVVLAKP